MRSKVVCRNIFSSSDIIILLSMMNTGHRAIAYLDSLIPHPSSVDVPNDYRVVTGANFAFNSQSRSLVSCRSYGRSHVRHHNFGCSTMTNCYSNTNSSYNYHGDNQYPNLYSESTIFLVLLSFRRIIVFLDMPLDESTMVFGRCDICRARLKLWPLARTARWTSSCNTALISGATSAWIKLDGETFSFDLFALTSDRLGAHSDASNSFLVDMGRTTSSSLCQHFSCDPSSFFDCFFIGGLQKLQYAGTRVIAVFRRGGQVSQVQKPEVPVH